MLSKKIKDIFKNPKYWSEMLPLDMVIPVLDLKEGPLKLLIRENKILFVANKKASDYSVMVFVLIDTIIDFYEKKIVSEFSKLSYREVESYLRDQNSVPSCQLEQEKELQSDFEQLIKAIELAATICDFMKKGKYAIESLSKNSLIGQFKFIQDISQTIINEELIPRGEHFRAYDWNGRTGKLTLECSVRSPISSDAQLILKTIFLYFDGVDEVKFVASE